MPKNNIYFQALQVYNSKLLKFQFFGHFLCIFSAEIHPAICYTKYCDKQDVRTHL